MPKFRIDAVTRATDGNLKILAAHHFEAESTADAERSADDWAQGTRLGTEADLRIVRSDLILAERRMGSQTKWIRS
jgi:hypothetical protein